MGILVTVLAVWCGVGLVVSLLLGRAFRLASRDPAPERRRAAEPRAHGPAVPAHRAASAGPAHGLVA
jgi:hypothetical protein